MLAYEPDRTIVHRLDPRGKLLVQLVFGYAAFAHTDLRGLAVLTGFSVGICVLARLRIGRVLRAFRFVFVLIGASIAIEGFVFGPPWISLADARDPALAGYRVALLLLVSAAYLSTTPVRESEAAIRWALPGRVGRVLATGTALVIRFLPVLRGDLAAIREAMAARLGGERPLTDRIERIGVGGTERALDRADRLALAMRSRCLSWNPTLPALSFAPRDLPVFVLAAGLLAWTVV